MESVGLPLVARIGQSPGARVVAIWTRRLAPVGLMALITAVLLGTEPRARAQGTSCPPGLVAVDAGHVNVVSPGPPPVIVEDDDVVCVPGDTFAIEVVDFDPGEYPAGDTCLTTDPQPWPINLHAKNQNGTASGTLGEPETTNPFQFGGERVNTDTSLGLGGVLTLRFGVSLSGSGNSEPDIWVWEVGPAAEPYRVQVLDGGTWVTVGESNQTTNGSQGFDIDDNGYGITSRFTQIRIVDFGTALANCTAGSDIDVVAILWTPERVPTVTPVMFVILTLALIAVASMALRRRRLETA